MSRSAYFPSDDAGERSLGVSFLAPPPPRHHVVVSERQLLVHSSPSCSEFPITSYVLWDRSPLSSVVRSVGSRGDSFPRLYMSCASIDALLSDMDGSGLGGGDVLFAAEQVDGGVLSLSRVVSSPSAAQASVPVSVVAYSASLQSLLFSPESTQDLIKNLRVQYMTGRNYTLKSCFRLRAAGFISNSTSASLHGTLRFEVLVPNETFSFQQIRPLPLLSTPLSMKLTAVSSLSSVTGCSSSLLHGGDGMPRQMGYLTLNKTRKAVPLHETDPAVSLAPLVGVWVTARNAGSCETVHRDPFVVGACVRFLKDSRIRERVFVDSEKTFLLAIFSGYSTEFMEVSHESANNDGGEGDDFCVLDFTVDLSRGGEPVLGNFRGRGGQGGDHDVSTTSDASVAVTSLLQIKYYGDVQILTNNNNSSSSSSNPASLVEETPLPRTSMQLPTPEAYRASPQGTLRASLSLSEGTFSNRSSLDDEQLMRVRELVGGLRDSEEYADDFDTEDDAEAGFGISGGGDGGGNNDKIGFEENDGGDDESSCSGGSSQNSRSSSQKSQGATVAANPVRTSPQQASKALDSDDEDYLEDASMLAPRLMSIPNDDSDFTLSSAMRRIYFPTNPLASLSPCVPALRPLGEDDSLLMETCMVGLRLSTNSNPFSAAVTQDLEEQVRDIMLHDQDD